MVWAVPMARRCSLGRTGRGRSGRHWLSVVGLGLASLALVLTRGPSASASTFVTQTLVISQRAPWNPGDAGTVASFQQFTPFPGGTLGSVTFSISGFAGSQLFGDIEEN